jgi:hypothetical protein
MILLYRPNEGRSIVLNFETALVESILYDHRRDRKQDAETHKE